MPRQSPNQWEQEVLKFICAGLQTATPGDLKTDGKYRRLQNVRVREQGVITTRPGLASWTGHQIGGDINQIRKFINVSGSTILVVGSAATVGLATQAGGIVATKGGFSGDPVTVLVWEPELQGLTYAYVYSRSQQLKKNPTLSTGGLDAWLEIGISPPGKSNTAAYDVVAAGAPVVAVGAGIGLTGTYTYIYRYRSTVNGVRSEFSAISLEVIAANQSVDLSAILASGDVQTDKIDIFRIGGTLLNFTFVATIDEGVTTFSDTATDLSLAGNEIRETFELHKPWVARDAAGTLKGGVPLERAVVHNGFVLAVGDPNNPGNLYWTNGNDPDSMDRSNFLRVAESNSPLVNILVYDGRGYIFDHDRMFAVYPQISGATTFQTLPTSCKRGLYAPWAFAVGPEIYFLARDGIFATSGGPERSLSADIHDLFEHEGAVKEPFAQDAMIPVDMRGGPSADKYRLHYYAGVLYFDYAGIDGGQHTLVYDFAIGGWFYDIYAGSPVRIHYGIEGTAGSNRAETDVISGDTSGNLFVYRHGSRDWSGSGFINFSAIVEPPFYDFRDPRNQKLFGDLILEFDRADANNIFVTPTFNNGDVTLTATVISAGTGRQVKIIDINNGNGQLARNISLRIQWDTESDNPSREGPFLFAWHPVAQSKPDETIRRLIEWHPVAEGVQDGYVYGVQLWIDTEGQAVVFEVHRDQINTGITFTANANGELRLPFTWVASVFKAKLCKLIPKSTNANAFRLTRWEWLYYPEPPRTPDVDTNWQDALESSEVGYVTGVTVEFDSFNASKALIFQSELEGAISLRVPREGASKTHNGRRNDSYTFTPFRAQQLRVHSTDGVETQIYDVRWHVTPEPPALANFDAQFEDWGRPNIVKGVEIYADTQGVAKTVDVELDGAFYETITVNHSGRRAVAYPLKRDTDDEFPHASFVRLIPTDTNEAFFYRARWLKQEEPDLISNWDAAWVNLGENHIIKGVRIEADTEGVAKTVIVQLDGVTVATLTINHSGRKGVDYDLPQQAGGEYPRGQVARLLPTDANPGRFYGWKPISEAEPPKLANWNPQWSNFGTPALKFCQGIRITADTEGALKQFDIEYDGGTLIGPFNVNHALRNTTVHSFDQPFLAHDLRIVPRDANPAWLYDADLIFDVAPDLGLVWQTQETTHDLPGFIHHRDGYLAYESTDVVTLTLSVDGVDETYTFPSTSGAYAKTYFAFRPKKGKAFTYRTSSPAGHRIFRNDCEFRVKAWGSEVAYQSVRPFGDLHRTQGARI